MKPKKTKKANLENKKGLFFQIGLIFSLALALLAFEWSTGELNRDRIPGSGVNFTTGVDVINTYAKKELPPVVKHPEAVELIIKDDDEDVLSRIFASVEVKPWDEYEIRGWSEVTEEPVDDVPFRICEVMPTFMNGDLGDFVKYIQSVVRYPEDALIMEIQGKIFADFVVNREGKIENVRIIRSVDPLLDNEVLRALNASPRWKPGKQRDIPVKVAYTIPIVFKIN